MDPDPPVSKEPWANLCLSASFSWPSVVSQTSHTCQIRASAGEEDPEEALSVAGFPSGREEAEEVALNNPLRSSFLRD